MIKINKLTDYATLMLGYLAQMPERKLSAADISKALGLALPTVSKILKILQNNHIVRSQRGTAGGYQLAREAQDISLVEILQAMEGPVAVTECTSHPGLCIQEHTCLMKTPWQQINHMILRRLKTISLLDMTRPQSIQWAAFNKETT